MIIIIELPLVDSGNLATFYLTPPFVIHQGKNKEGKYRRETSVLVDTVHNNGGWRIDLPMRILKEALKSAIHEKGGYP